MYDSEIEEEYDEMVNMDLKDQNVLTSKNNTIKDDYNSITIKKLQSTK